MVENVKPEPREVRACKAVLFEIMKILAGYLDNIVLIGGNVPPLLFPDREEDYAGTIDVDLAVDPADSGISILQHIIDDLLRAGYEKGNERFRLERAVHLSGEDEPVKIYVDLLTTADTGIDQKKSDFFEMGIAFLEAEGCRLAFDTNEEKTIEGTLPDGGIFRGRIRIPGTLQLIAMKGLAWEDRKEDKDAYDIYFCLDLGRDELNALIEQGAQFIKEEQIKRSLQYIGKNFRSPEYPGPVAVARYISTADTQESELIKRNASEKVTYFIRGLGIRSVLDFEF
ncbi:MAG: hypothetical protein JW854_02770 [Actinobacteria bacterium]|nr:hypothetical protein [Actinomycetota bacterium]